MSEDTIVPYRNATVRNEALLARMRGVKAQKDDGEQPGNPNIAAIEQILAALEGMQTQIQTLTDLVVEQDKRLEKLERRKIIRGIGS